MRERSASLEQVPRKSLVEEPVQINVTGVEIKEEVKEEENKIETLKPAET